MEKWIETTLSLKEVKNLLKENVIEVTSPDGWVPVTKYIEKGNKVAWNLEVDDISVLSSDKHLYETNNGWKFAKDLDCEMDLILTENGLKNFKISKTNKKIKVVDISVNHKNHRYYTNGISSHNTNLGKSLIMTSLGVDCILRNKNVLYVTCEMSEEKISERVMSNMFDIAGEDLKLLTRSKFHEKFESIRKQVKNKFVVKEYPTKSINVNHIRNLVKELKVRKKFVPDIIFVDYLGIMNPIYRSKNDNTYLEVKRISEELRGMAVELGLPIVSAVQTNRCLDLDTIVTIIKDNEILNIPIKNVEKGDLIKSSNGFNTVLNKFENENTDCYEITLKSGKKIICSSNHLHPTGEDEKIKSIDNGLKIGDLLKIVKQSN